MTNQTRPDVLLLHTIGWGLYVESVDPFSPRLVLYDYLPAEVPDVWSEDIIFNIQSRQFEDILCTNREEVPACDIVNAGDQHLFTMRMGEQGENLYVFNWLTRQLIDKKYHIEKIIEWRQDLQSFIVQQGEYPMTGLSQSNHKILDYRTRMIKMAIHQLFTDWLDVLLMVQKCMSIGVEPLTARL